MVEFTFIAHDNSDGNAYYQLQVRSIKNIFGEESHIRPLCHGTGDLKDLIDSMVPILRHSVTHGDLGIILIGNFSYMAYKAITNQVNMIAEGSGSKVYYHEHNFDIKSD